ncbi:MAG: glycoside hydrolase family 88 protein [Planctomycetes bacterium]|nr:glycoside hydrolase family 88 protein [Planctomycetota bacterium]
MKSLTTLALLLCLMSPVVSAEPVAKPPQEVAQQLLQVYGKKLDTVVYIPAVALYARWQFGELTGDLSQRMIVETVLGAPRPVPKSPVEFAGHLVYAGVARTAQGPLKESSLLAVRRAADQFFGPDKRLTRVPGPTEMSDSVFMCGPILCEAGSLTAEPHYFDGAVRYLSEMRRLRQREDGLYQHGHLCDAAWGRGNGFPAVGVAWCLSRLPADHAGRDELLSAFRRHMTALTRHQTASGMWRQVIDVPEAYEEFSATAMIGFAMQRGVTSGWLDRATFQPLADQAWEAVCKHLEPGGKIIDICEGTGTQKTLDDYLKRKAIRGVDDRGGAMGLLFAVERIAAAKK